MDKRFTQHKALNNSRPMRLLRDAYENIYYKNQVPLVYFSDIKNVGDLISPYLVEKLTHKKARRSRTSVFPRLLGVGSILGSGTYNSYVWGSGSIDGKLPKAELDTKKIFAVRGELTLALLRSRYSMPDDIPLGDPALIMPKFFQPNTEKKFRVGIIPHYVDFDRAVSLFSGCGDEYTVIDVRQDPEDFISKMLECECIASSSLHGLILSDAYGIPNIWIRLSNSLVGNFWKFLDYYSTTNNLTPSPLNVANQSHLFSAIDRKDNRIRVSNYKYSVDKLRNSFPVEIFT